MLNIILKGTISLLLLLLLAGTTSAGENRRIIAVAATDGETTGQISKVAARAPYFLFFDGQNRLLETEQNPFFNTGGGAGPKAADFLAEKKVDLVIAEQFGRKMLNKLQSYKIQTVVRQGRILDAVKEQNHAQ